MTPSQLEQIPKPYELIMRQLEQDIINDIVARLKANNEITRTADYEIYRLHQIGLSKAYIKKRIQEALNATDKEMNDLYNNIIASDYAKNETLYQSVGADFIPFEENMELQQAIATVIEHTKQELVNITQTTGFKINLNGKKVFTPASKVFADTLDRGMVALQQGTSTYDQVIKSAVQDMVKSGFQGIDYESGIHRNLVSASRMCIMTGLTQVTGKITEQNMQKLGTQFVETSWHATARPSHQVWQGRVFYWDKDNPNAEIDVDGVHYKSFIKETGYGTIEGLSGINCCHSYYSFIPGISKRKYTDEELARLQEEENQKKSWHGKEYTKYEATQRMRKLESIMRKQREELKVLKANGLDDDDYIDKKCRYQATSQEYSKFAEAMELPQERQRVYADGLGMI